MVPVVGIVGVAVWLLLTGREAFTAPIAFVGTITGPVLSGVFPMLLLLASRRAGEYVPAVGSGPLGRPVVAIAVAGLFLAALLVHVALWTDPVQRAVAILAGLATLGIAVRFVLRPPAASLVVELRLDRRAPATAYLTVTNAGRTAAVDVRLQRATDAEAVPNEVRSTPGLGVDLGAVDSVGRVEVDLPAARWVRLWVHELTEAGRSVPVAARYELSDQGGTAIRGSTEGAAGQTALSLERPATLAIRPAGSVSWAGAVAG
jgi:hypothetical protein